jgi:hypothetical protein
MAVEVVTSVTGQTQIQSIRTNKGKLENDENLI